LATWTDLLDSVLAQDKPVTQSLLRAFRDNLLAVIGADASAPRITTKAISSQYFLAQQATDFNFATGSSNLSQKMHFTTEVYDPDSLFDNSSSFRFIPSVAGLYLVSSACFINTGNFAVGNFYSIEVRKNGSVLAANAAAKSSLTNGLGSNCSINLPVQMNGSTDYLEIFLNDGSGNVSGGNGHRGYFSAIGLCEA
jgi:hypothetical protein